MPLPLRRTRSDRYAQPTSPQRAASTPTLLSRLRSSAFNSSKTSLLASSAYETVRARTPPRYVGAAVAIPVAESVRRSRCRSERYRKLHARWRLSASKLDKAAFRECLMEAECLGVTDPLIGTIRQYSLLVGKGR